jgi:hypothetical protein
MVAHAARILLASLCVLLAAAPAGAQETWTARHAEWTPADEGGFSAFVQALGEAECRTVDECMRSEANPYRGTDRRGSRFTADCADLPYLLRAYYASKHGLPFSFASRVERADVTDPGGDVRYTWYGNRVAGRRHVASRAENPTAAFRELVNSVSTATYRVDHRREHEPFHDLYPAALERGSIRPGTVLYDPRGHVAVVYRVDPDGRVRLLNAHPDNSITRTVYGPEYTRQDPALGGGFLNWRPQRLVGARRLASGALAGGRIEAARSGELADFSLAQYVGTRPHPTDWRLGVFIGHGPPTTDFHAYLRRALAEPGYRVDPLAEIASAVETLCDDLQDRVRAVEAARTAGIARRPAPARMPQNIYGASGDWETFSTPGRDARLRASFVALARLAEDLIDRTRGGDPSVIFDGPDPEAALLAAFDGAASGCSVTYTNSVGQPVRLNLDDVYARLFDLSFDPYHCPELRWGASGDELATCPDGPEKLRWYRAQRNLRHVVDRDANERMGWSLGELERIVPGPQTPANLDPRAVLKPVDEGSVEVR